MRPRFRPPLWSWVALLPMLALLLGLGTWQCQRGLYKTRLQATMDASTVAPPQFVGDEPPASSERLAPHLRISGEYLADRQLLLDNQSHDGHPGYHVWTALRTAAGRMFIVDRGWVAASGDRSQLPRINVSGAARSLSGLWRPLPMPGLRLGDDACTGAPSWPRVVQYPTAADLHCLYADLGGDPQPGLLLLDAAAADGYVRDWRVNAGLPPQRHYAYALQWYALAATLMFLFVKLNLRRSD